MRFFRLARSIEFEWECRQFVLAVWEDAISFCGLQHGHLELAAGDLHQAVAWCPEGAGTKDLVAWASVRGAHGEGPLDACHPGSAARAAVVWVIQGINHVALVGGSDQDLLVADKNALVLVVNNQLREVTTSLNRKLDLAFVAGCVRIEVLFVHKHLAIRFAFASHQDHVGTISGELFCRAISGPGAAKVVARVVERALSIRDLELRRELAVDEGDGGSVLIVHRRVAELNLALVLAAVGESPDDAVRRLAQGDVAVPARTDAVLASTVRGSALSEKTRDAAFPRAAACAVERDGSDVIAVGGDCCGRRPPLKAEGTFTRGCGFPPSVHGASFLEHDLLHGFRALGVSVACVGSVVPSSRAKGEVASVFAAAVPVSGRERLGDVIAGLVDKGRATLREGAAVVWDDRRRRAVGAVGLELRWFCFVTAHTVCKPVRRHHVEPAEDKVVRGPLSRSEHRLAYDNACL